MSQDKEPDIAPKQQKRIPYKSHDQLEKDLVGFYTMVGMGVMAFNAFDGMVIMENAEKLGQSVNNVAKHNKPFRDTLVRLMQISIYGALISAHATVAIAIGQNHGVIPKFGSLDDYYENLDEGGNPVNMEDVIKAASGHGRGTD